MKKIGISVNIVQRMVDRKLIFFGHISRTEYLAKHLTCLLSMTSQENVK